MIAAVTFPSVCMIESRAKRHCVPLSFTAFTQLPAGALVRAAFGSRHEQTILAQHLDSSLPLPDACLVLGVARLCLGRRAAPWRDRDYLEGIGETIANEIDPVTNGDPGSRRRAPAVQAHVSARNRSGCLTARLEEAAVVKPAIDSQRSAYLLTAMLVPMPKPPQPRAESNIERGKDRYSFLMALMPVRQDSPQAAKNSAILRSRA